MSLQQSIAAYSRRPTAVVRLNGQQVQIPNTAGAISLARQFGQPIKGGSIKLINCPFQPIPKMPININWGYDGYNVPALTGFVTNPGRESYPKAWTVQVKDMLWLADYTIEDPLDPGEAPTSGMFFGNNKTALEVFTALLTNFAGIPANRIKAGPFEKSPGVPWMLGTLSPIKFNGSPLAACLQICDALGLWLFADASGIVRTLPLSGAPTSYPLFTWRSGLNVLVDGAPTVSSDIDLVYNQVMVTGANTGVEGAQVRDKFRVDTTLLPDGKNRTFTYNNSLIEFVNEADGGIVSCTKVAERMVTEHSRDPFIVTAKVKAVPDLDVGWTVALQDPRIGLNSPRKFFVMGYTDTFGGAAFEQQLTLDGGIGRAGYTLIPPPFASFTWRLMAETMDHTGDSGSDDVIDIFLDGSGSTPMGGGEIVSWTWTIAPTDAVVAGTPTTASGKFAVFIVPADTVSVDITLTVTDVTSKTNSLTQTVTMAGDLVDVPAKRALNFAAKGWYVSPDGGKTWGYETTRLAQAVPPIGNEGSAQSTDPTGAKALGLITTKGATAHGLRHTKDYLGSTSVALTTSDLAGPIEFIWQNERDPLRVWVCVGNNVHLSVDGGITFGTGKHPPAAPAVGGFPDGDTDFSTHWIVEAFDNLGVIDVLAGRCVFTSFDSGETWVLGLTGPAGATARCYTSGFTKHWVGFTNCPMDSTPIRSTEGDDVGFPPEIDPQPTGIEAITMMADTPDVYAFDSIGRIWRFDADSGNNVELKGTLPDA